MPPWVQAKVPYSLEQWETKLAATKPSKADMNRLIMDFLVTEG